MSRREPNGLEYIIKDANQFDNIEYTQAGLDKVFGILTTEIGSLLVAFSELEHSLDIAIAETFDNRNHQVGMIVTKKLTYIQKVLLFYDLAMRICSYHQLDLKNQLKALKKELVYMAEIRNVVAHAKWLSITDGAFVRSQVTGSADSGTPFIKYYKINKSILRDASLRMNEANMAVDKFREDLTFPLDIGYGRLTSNQ